MGSVTPAARKTLVGLEEWERIPNIKDVIKRAEGTLLARLIAFPVMHASSLPVAPDCEGLDSDKTPRKLRDLFVQYEPYQYHELPWFRTECAIDAVQATAYLVQAVVFLYKAWKGMSKPSLHITAQTLRQVIKLDTNPEGNRLHRAGMSQKYP